MNAKHILILLILILGMITIIGCQALFKPEIATSDLILPLEALPPTWEMAYAPRPMGSHIGFGDEDDTYVSFKLKSSIYHISGHYVMYYPTLGRAKTDYENKSRSWFNDHSIAVDAPWQTPAELSYTSPFADQFRMACTINNIAGQEQVCTMLARYGKYVVIFHSVIAPDTISLSEFNGVVQYLDKMMARKLGLDQE